MPKTILLAAYGTLRLEQPNWRRLLRRCPYLGTISVNDFALLDAGAFPYAVRRPGHRVIADLFALDDDDLARCDALEGFPVDYLRSEVPTPLGPAWMYYNDSAMPHLPVIPGGDWVAHVQGRESGHDGR